MINEEQSEYYSNIIFNGLDEFIKSFDDRSLYRIHKMVSKDPKYRFPSNIEFIHCTFDI